MLNFVQQDLVVEDVMLLDVGDALFVWLGIHSNQQGKIVILDHFLSHLPSFLDIETNCK